MPRFHYQALNADEQPVTGALEAANLAQAVAELELQGLSIQSIGTAPLTSTASGENPFADDAAAPQAAIQRAALEQHLARVIERGRELLPALRAYAQELPAGRRRRELESVLEILERGDAGQAARTLGTMPGFWIPLLGAAASSRDPGRILREFVEESERASELARQWWLTLAYPAFLGGLAVAVLVLLSVLVIPVFAEMFGEFGLSLPYLTLLVLSIAESIASGRVLITAGVVLVAGWLVCLAVRQLPARLRNWCGDRFGLSWGRATALARFSQFAADLLEAELQPSQAVRLAGIATGNPPLCRAAERVANALESSTDFARPGNRRILTATILHALDADAAAPSRIRLLREISAGYAERARIRLSWTRGIIEPLAICVIGLIVGSTVLALFLPLVTLIHGLT